jgi:acetyltransferase-like isoleucine patch superfamily enzyme
VTFRPGTVIRSGVTKLQEAGSQEFLADRSKSALAKYQMMVVGDRGLWKLITYELITCLLGPMPGALGFYLRQKFYPMLFRACGRGVLFGRNLIIRHPGRIRLGGGVVLSDDVLLDAKGTEGEGILIRDGVFIGRGTAITMIDGTLEIDEGANIGTYCRIGTYGYTRIGKKALIAAFVYVVGADHQTDRTDIPILDQPNFTHGGVTVGDGTWLGTKASVKDGVQIGRDCIVGAHALVTENLPDFAVAVGIPAKVVKLRK